MFRRLTRLLGATLILGSPALAAVAGFTLQAASLPELKPATTVVLARAKSGPEKAVAHITVQPGDSIGHYADLYGVSARDIRIQSGIQSDKLEVGQELRIPFWARPERESRVPPGVRVHVIQEGEVLSTIRAEYGVSEIALISANLAIPSLDHLSAGTELLIPNGEDGVITRIKPGQSVVDVANYFSVPLREVARANGISDPRALHEGDYVLVPGKRANSKMASLQEKRAAEIAAIEKARAEAEARRQAEIARAQAEAEARRQQEIARAQAEARRQAQIAATQRQQRLEAERQASARARQRETVTTRRAVATSYYRRPASQEGYGYPMRSYTISSGYGRRGFWIGNSNFHTGVDFAAPTGTPIYAAHSGTVLEAGYGDFGLDVFIAAGEGIVNIYGHMSRLAVTPGESVSRGELIGYVGCTGICTGPHLHFEVREGGVPQNPYNYLN